MCDWAVLMPFVSSFYLGVMQWPRCIYRNRKAKYEKCGSKSQMKTRRTCSTSDYDGNALYMNVDVFFSQQICQIENREKTKFFFRSLAYWESRKKNGIKKYWGRIFPCLNIIIRWFMPFNARKRESRKKQNNITIITTRLATQNAE